MRLVDAQIEKAHKQLRGLLKAMLAGKRAINYKDFKRSGQTKEISFFGSVTVRQTLRFVEDLIYCKSQVKELQKALEQILETPQGTWFATTGEGHAECLKIARQALKGSEPK